MLLFDQVAGSWASGRTGSILVDAYNNEGIKR